MADYLGCKAIKFTNQELSDFYSDIKDNSKLKMLINQYLIIETDGPQDIPFKWNGEEFREVPYKTLDSKLLGLVKPKDLYQRCYIDSLINNQFTIATGPAGSAKSFLALAYAFQELERENLNRIVMFSNPMVAKDAAKLGFYKGTRGEKVLDSSIGGILMSKIGSRILVDKMIEHETLVLLPIGDARGYQVPEHSFCYFSEGQNTNIPLMKLFLQRITNTSKVVAEGDLKAQVDSPSFENGANGLRRAIDVFAGEDYFSHIELKTIWRGKLAAHAELM